jgi:chloramphenicol 3-O-phosphotransferase
MNQILILSGPAGAGKTSVALAICERFDRMVHVEVDVLRHWVRAGYRHPWAGDRQAEEQLELAARNASAIARECIAMRYAVVIDDVVLAKQAAIYREALVGVPATVELVTLLPSLEAALARDAGRGERLPPGGRIEELHARIAREVEAGALPGAVIDSTRDPNADVTADRVMETIARGDALLVRAAKQ